MNRIRILSAPAFALSLLVFLGNNARAVPLLPAELARGDSLSSIEFVQAKQRTETVKQKVKRIWRDLTGYKFDVACPVFPFALTRTTCTATGADREEARAKCQSQHVFCQVRDANR